MSELICRNKSESTLRWQLLTSASALALLAAVAVAPVSAFAEDTEKPTVWIELGGVLERVHGQGDVFAPPFVAENADQPVFSPTSPAEAQRSPVNSYGVDGKISFKPHGSDWTFAAAFRYGRSSNKKFVHLQSFRLVPDAYSTVAGYSQGFVANYAETSARHAQSHFIVDFEVGKDVGIGILGRGGISRLGLGLRFAQMSTSNDVLIRARPDVEFYPLFPGPSGYFPGKYWRNYVVRADSSRSFQAVGPSLSLQGSEALLGSSDEASISFDWGVNGALLFGRQKANVHHQTTGRKRYQLATNCCSHTSYVTAHYVTRYKIATSHNRSRSIVVPNIGAFAGLSFRYAEAKVSFGYRGDFFIGAMDGGIDASENNTISFHGPFAKVSIGLGG